MNRAFLSQDGLSPGNAVRIDPAIAVMPESRTVLRARSESHPHAARAAMQVQHQIHISAYAFGDFFHLGIIFKDARKAWFHYYAQPQIRPLSFEKRQCRSGK